MGKGASLFFLHNISKSDVLNKFKDINYFKDFTVDPEVKTPVWGNDNIS